MVDRLEGRGLIVRQPDPMDPRGTILALTKQTNAQVTVALRFARHRMETLVSGYPQKDPAVLK